MFSEKVLGDGVGIIPDEDIIVAPCTARVMTLMEDSKHAVGLALGNGMELLIHVGIDTVSMNGTGFEYLAGMDAVVKAGDPLIRFDRNEIKKAGHPDTVVFVVTEEADCKVSMHSGTGVKAAQDTVMTIS